MQPPAIRPVHRASTAKSRPNPRESGAAWVRTYPYTFPPFSGAENRMRISLPKVACLRWFLLAMSVAICLPLSSCRLPSSRKKSTDAGAAHATKSSNLIDLFRDQQALEIEQHMNEQ